MDLPLDIKFKIASFDIDSWIRLSFIDDEFKVFSYKEGRKLFIDLFTIIRKNDYMTTCKIFNKYHSKNDIPALIYEGDNYWYQNEKLHRDNDHPAIMYKDGGRLWYQHGKLHRDNDQPAVIEIDGNQYWYQNNKLHRDSPDGLKPAVIYFDGIKEWYNLGRNIDNH